MPARIGARLQAIRAHARPPPRVVSARARRHARVGPARLGGPLAPLQVVVKSMKWRETTLTIFAA
eukprot:4807533-Prymnesium_polylepis.1